MVHVQANMFVCMKSFTREAFATREKLNPWLSLLVNVKLCYKQNRLANRVIVSLVALIHFKKTCN